MAEDRTALIFEDDEAIRALVATMLGRAGYRVRTFGDPAEALRAAEQRRPDVYVLDVRLPGRSGRALCRILKADPATNSPVLMISGECSAPDVSRAWAAGCDDFLAKPFRRAQLVERVDLLLAGQSVR